MIVWFKRISFILFLGMILFTAEYYLHPKKKFSVEKKNKRFLVLGGSVAFNIESSMRRYIDHLGVEDTSVHSFVGTGLSSEYSVKILPELIKEFRPTNIFILLGMNEDHLDGSPDDIEDEVGLLREKKLRNLLRIKDKRVFAEEFEKVLDFDLNHNRCSGLYEFGIALMINDTEHFHSMNLSPTMEMLKKKITKNSTPLECKLALLKIANFLRYHQSAIYGVDFRSDFPSQAERVNARRRFLSFFRKFYEEGLLSIKTQGEKNFLDKGPSEEFLDRYWLTLVAKNQKRMNVSFQEFIQYSSDMSPYRYIITKLHSIKGSEDEEGKVFDEAIETWPGKQNDLVNMKFPVEFKDNIRILKEIAEKSGAKVWILQYPNLRLEYLSRIGKELEITVLDGKTVFEGKINDENYYQYFIDKRSGSGHMTELGALLYGKSILQQSGLLDKYNK